MRRSWRIVLICVVVLLAVAATGLGAAYSLGAFAEQGKFKALPGCGVLDQATVAPVVPGARIEADGDNCTATNGQVQLKVGYTLVAKKGTVGGPQLAARALDAVAGGEMETLKGVGDQAMRQRTRSIGGVEVITMRVSNLIVVLAVANLSGSDLPPGAEDGLVQVAKALGARLSA